jgi:hypothetical protein
MLTARGEIKLRIERDNPVNTAQSYIKLFADSEQSLFRQITKISLNFLKHRDERGLLLLVFGQYFVNLR